MRLNMHLSTALPALVLASAVTANFRRDGAADTTAGTIGSKKYIVEVVPV
jgi:hypothetical protein